MNHSFDVDVARLVGVNAAIVFQKIAYICDYHKTNGEFFYDGRHWMFNSRKAFSEQYDYLTEKQVRLAIEKLLDAGLIVKGCYNSKNFDRTSWYALTDEGQRYFREGPIRPPEKADTSDQMGQPIPLHTNVTNTPLGVDDDDERAREYNPFGDGNVPFPKIDTVQKYAMQQLNAMGHRAMEELNSFVEDLSEDIVRHAIDNALDNGKRTWAYVRAILNGYVDAGVRKVADAEEQDAKHRQRQSAAEQPAQPKEPQPFVIREPERKPVRRNVVLRTKDDKFAGVLYEDGEIKGFSPDSKFTHVKLGLLGEKRISIVGYGGITRWEDAKCEPGTQLSDFFE